jgi:hypothetical protein
MWLIGKSTFTPLRLDEYSTSVKKEKINLQKIEARRSVSLDLMGDANDIIGATVIVRADGRSGLCG